jgi:hypothetical protein
MTIKLTDARANVHLDPTMSTEADIEALIAAVRAETLREVRVVVDNLTHSRAHPDDYYYSVMSCDHSEQDGRGGYDVYVERSDILAALDALEGR